MTHNKSERGQALVLIVFAIVALIGLTGLAIDGGNAYSDRRNAQNAADTAALAAALSKVQGASATTWESVGAQRAQSNGYSIDGTSSWVLPCTDSNTYCGTYAGNAEYLQVQITSHVKTYFARVLGFNEFVNVVTAIAHTTPSVIAPYYNGAAIVGLAQTGCDTVNFAGNSQLQIWGTGIFSNSNSNCGLDIQGSTSVQTYNAGITTVASGYTTNGNPSVDTYGYGITGNASQQPYPPPNLPNPVCTGSATKSGSTMSGGTYSGTFPPSGVTTLQSGIYCVTGDFVMNGGQTLTGSNVVIVLENGAIQWNGNSQVNISAPTSGPFAGLLIYSPVSNTNTMQINGSSNSSLTGTVLLPGANIVVNGNNSQLQKVNSQLIGYTVTLSGSSDTQIQMDMTNQYQFTTAPTIQLTR
ncbi:MAG: Tad domain-containing protein [Chloroflexi bacterium]|nr:Tad domain-containing protein [Chloroflexota bacterium]